MSPPPEMMNSTLEGVPLGPYATIGDEEWKRFEVCGRGCWVGCGYEV